MASDSLFKLERLFWGIFIRGVYFILFDFGQKLITAYDDFLKLHQHEHTNKSKDIILISDLKINNKPIFPIDFEIEKNIILPLGYTLCAVGIVVKGLGLLIQLAMSRSAEFAADSHAAKVTSSSSMINALKRLSTNDNIDKDRYKKHIYLIYNTCNILIFFIFIVKYHYISYIVPIVQCLYIILNNSNLLPRHGHILVVNL